MVCVLKPRRACWSVQYERILCDVKIIKEIYVL